METKALFLDLDGTLLDDKREITAGNRAAIDKALEAGHKVIITTGRPLVSAVKQGEKIGLTAPGCYLISFNGGMIYDCGAKKVIFKQTIPMKLVREVFGEAARRQIHIQTYDENYVRVEKFNDNDYVRRYCNKINMEFRTMNTLDDLPDEPVKMLLIDYESREKTGAFRDWVNATYAGVLDCFFSCKEYIEIVPTGLNKGNALRNLAAKLNISIENTISAGDEENDLTMIAAAGTGCAMANAVDSVKAQADYITEHDNNHDGIAEIIEKFMM